MCVKVTAGQRWDVFWDTVYINDLEDDAVSNVFKFADDTKLFR